MNGDPFTAKWPLKKKKNSLMFHYLLKIIQIRVFLKFVVSQQGLTCVARREEGGAGNFKFQYKSILNL